MSHFSELQGYIRAEEHLQWLLAALGQGWRAVPGLRNAAALRDPDGTRNGLTNVEVNYTLKPVVPAIDVFARNDRYFTHLRTQWVDSGYRVITDRAAMPRVLRVVWPGDGFTVALKQGVPGNLWMTASSSPVRRDRIKPPPPAIRHRPPNVVRPGPRQRPPRLALHRERPRPRVLTPSGR